MNRQSKTPTRIAKMNKVSKTKTQKRAVRVNKRKIATKIAPKSAPISSNFSISAPSTPTTAQIKAQRKGAAIQSKNTVLTQSTASFTTKSPKFATFSTFSPQQTFTTSQANLPQLPQGIADQISSMKFVPTGQNTVLQNAPVKVNKMSKRTFLNNMKNMAAGMFGGNKQPGPDGVQHGLGSMMDMMEMMQMMQKVTNIVKNPNPSKADYDEICNYIEKLRAKQGGKLQPEIDQLLQKIQRREPIAQDEVMTLLGINPTEAEEIRTMTLDVKSGKANQMQFMMKVAEIFQRAQLRKEEALKSVPEIKK
jgi:hypothetical protein